MKALGIVTIAIASSHATAWEQGDSTALKRALADNEATLVAAIISELGATQWRGGSSMVVNCTVSPEACAEHDVTSFPAIRLYRRGQSLVRYRATGCDSALTNEKLDAFASSDSVVFIAHLGRDDGSTASRLSSLADAYRDRYSFGVAQGSLSDQSTLQCHNNEDGMQHRRVDFDHPGALEALLATCAEPLIPEMSRRNELKYTQHAGRSIVYYLSDDASEREAYVAAMRPVAKRLREYLQFVTVDSGEFPDMSHALGVASEGGLVVENLHTGQVYPFRGRERESSAEAKERHRIPAAEAVEDFIMAIAQGHIEPWNGRYGDGDSMRRDGGDDASRHDEL
ncbi:hypothetical protein ACCO45_005442 [Purpureocillium lilacinum]|uniref:Uncharacterized protein n=1 Tax=Purpureocillium lilacinum TaxID=33203 RepID=A0ACC4DVG1_PURLI